MSAAFASVGAWVTTLVLWFVLSVVLLSFIEHFIHRHFMHRRSLPSGLYRRLAFLDEYFHAHAVLHHTTFYRVFNFEPDPVGREIDMRLGFLTAARLYAGASPIALGLVLVAPAGAAIFSVVAIAHMYLWGVLHHEMHVPASRFLQGLAAYRFLARHHFLHHRYPRRNFNVVIPLADALIGTLAQAKLCDIREVLRLGHLLPRHPRTAERLGRRMEHPDLPARRLAAGQMRRIMPGRTRCA